MDEDEFEQSWVWQELRQRAAAKMLLRILTGFWGPPDDATRNQVGELSNGQLDELAVTLHQFKTPDDLKTWLSLLPKAPGKQ